MEEILYVYGKNLYVNLTNQCPCRCSFCIRSQQEGLGSAGSLWLKHRPTAEEVVAAFANYRLEDYGEVIFCGYGEPLCALDELLEVCRCLRAQGAPRVRVNTNGLGDRINEKPTAPLLEGLVDAVSISLNAPDAQSYLALCRPSFGLDAFDGILRFARECRRYVPEVVFSVVDVIPEEQIERCGELAGEMGIPLRVRHYSE